MLPRVGTQVNFVLSRDGFYRHTESWDFIGDETELVEGVVRRAPGGVMGNIMPGRHMCLSQLGLSLASSIPKLTLHTYFAPMTGTDEKVVLVPVFVKEGRQSADMTMEWTLPGFMKLYFVTRWIFPAGHTPINGVSGLMPLCYLIAEHAVQLRTYCLPLPNLYADGKVCMGHSLEKINLSSHMFLQFDYCLDAFLKSRWNSDLLDATNGRRSKQMFRFDSKGRCLPPEMDWPLLCNQVNHDAYSFLVKVP